MGEEFNLILLCKTQESWLQQYTRSKITSWVIAIYFKAQLHRWNTLSSIHSNNGGPVWAIFNSCGFGLKLSEIDCQIMLAYWNIKYVRNNFHVL